MERPVVRVLDLVPEASQSIVGLSLEEARHRMLAAEPAGVLGMLDGFGGREG